jgi:L-2-hydroxyglutarate oxidase LhgO
MDRVDAVVIGAGVVGLACARELGRLGFSTLVVERNQAIGLETSSRNSEVIHAGLHYPQGSLKARYCVDGNKLLYDYCFSHGVDYRRCGKLVVATTAAQEERLFAMLNLAVACGVRDVRLLSRKEAKSLESELACTAALLSPSTGIIDSRGFMLSLLADAEAHGVDLALCSDVERVQVSPNNFMIHGSSHGEVFAISSRILINAAGLHAPRVAARFEQFRASYIPKAKFAKGSYFSLTGKIPFSHLIYPVPEQGGLGVHLTLDLAGQARFGPDVEWVDEIDYEVDPKRSEVFYSAIRKYWPALRDDSLLPAYSGIRPKIVGEGESNADFLIQGPADHSIDGLVNLFGIESPGLTSSLAIAADVGEIATANK